MPNVFSVFLTRSGLKTLPNWPYLLFVFLSALTHPELGINRQIFIKQCFPPVTLSHRACQRILSAVHPSPPSNSVSDYPLHKIWALQSYSLDPRKFLEDNLLSGHPNPNPNPAQSLPGKAQTCPSCPASEGRFSLLCLYLRG